MLKILSAGVVLLGISFQAMAQTQLPDEKSSVRLFSVTGEIKGFAKCYTSFWQCKDLHAAIYHDDKKSVDHFVFFDRATGITTRGRISNREISVSSRGIEEFPQEFLGRPMVDDDASLIEQEEFLKQYAEVVTKQIESVSINYLGKRETEPKFRYAVNFKIKNLNELYRSLKEIKIEKKIIK